MATLEEALDGFPELFEDIRKSSNEVVVNRTRLLENEIKVVCCCCRCCFADTPSVAQMMKSEINRISHEHASHKEKIKENMEKIKVNKVLPYLVANIVEVGGCKDFFFFS